MKKAFIISLTAFLSVAALTGCTRSSYAIHTNDARTIISDGKPTTSDTGMLGYTDAWGKKQQINKAEVKEVTELPN